VDEVIPSREKSGYQAQIQTRATAAAAQQQAQAPESGGENPDGSPKGGMEANTVQNRVSGKAA